MKATERRNDESHFDSSDWSEVNVLVSALSKSSCPVKLISKRLHCKLQQPQPTLNNVTKTYHKTVSTIACSHDRNLCNQRNPLNENKQESSKMGTSVQTMHKAKPSKRQYEQMLNIPSCQRRTAFLIQNDIEFTCLSKYNFDDAHIDLVSNSCTRTSSKFTNDLNIKEIIATRKRFRMECKERCNAESNERGASLRLQAAKQRYELHVAERKRRESFEAWKSGRRDNIKKLYQKQNSRSKLQLLMEVMETGGLGYC